ncbi:MAG: RNA ligase family protein [Alphaproteobacteria bacterium]|nr:RNA ligase family protein [Alphaproteobacteria bacterium]
MTEYHKIENIYKRNSYDNKLLKGVYLNTTVRYLENCKWDFTEKIDGMNIRIIWDGYKVSFAGRTDNASIPTQLGVKLADYFMGDAKEELFEQKFGKKEVVLYGEGFGAGIQSGDNYSKVQTFILFDVNIGGIWLDRDSVAEISSYFGILKIPSILTLKEATLKQGVKYIISKPKSLIGNCEMEGIIARPLLELKDKQGERIIVKIKCCDF